MTTKVYTMNEVAKVFNRHRETIYMWVKRGKLKPIYVLGHPVFTEKEVQRVLNEQAFK